MFFVFCNYLRDAAIFLGLIYAERGGAVARAFLNPENPGSNRAVACRPLDRSAHSLCTWSLSYMDRARGANLCM